MKKCSWCGKENDDAQLACLRCGTDLPPTIGAVAVDDSASTDPQPTDTNTIPTPVRIDFKKRAAFGIVAGFAVGFVGKALRDRSPDVATLRFALALYFAGAVLFVWGCANYAAGKGYSRWFGALGLLSCIGLLILVVLPDRRKGYDDHTS